MIIEKEKKVIAELKQLQAHGYENMVRVKCQIELEI
jgi:hypothetical protein